MRLKVKAKGDYLQGGVESSGLWPANDLLVKWYKNIITFEKVQFYVYWLKWCVLFLLSTKILMTSKFTWFSAQSGSLFLIYQVQLPKTQPDGRPRPYSYIFDVKLGYRQTQILSNTEHNIIIRTSSWWHRHDEDMRWFTIALWLHWQSPNHNNAKGYGFYFSGSTHLNLLIGPKYREEGRI